MVLKEALRTDDDISFTMHAYVHRCIQTDRQTCINACIILMHIYIYTIIYLSGNGT